MERDAILDELKFQLLKAQQLMKANEDKKRHDVNFTVGDMVYLKLQPYRQQSLAKRVYEKLSPRFYGPYAIVQKVGTVAYKLQLPSTGRIHPVFHVSQLKRAMGDRWQPTTLPAQLTEDLELLVEPGELLGVRSKQLGSNTVREVLIQWRDQSKEEATWELFENIDQLFPQFHLEDKVGLWGWGDAMPRPPLTFTYSRRAKKGNSLTPRQQ